MTADANRPRWCGYTAHDCSVCRREANLRRSVYSNRVMARRMSKHQSDARNR